MLDTLVDVGLIDHVGRHLFGFDSDHHDRA
jgi:hypothetical protein